jgi:hypothetical protein
MFNNIFWGIFGEKKYAVLVNSGGAFFYLLSSEVHAHIQPEYINFLLCLFERTISFELMIIYFWYSGINTIKIVKLTRSIK